MLRGADADTTCAADEARLTVQIDSVARSSHHLVEEATDALKRLIILLLLSYVRLG